jgi:hypothetical protein
MSDLTLSRVRPLRVRHGARFRCAGDGMCCSDLHLLGPLSRLERQLFGVFAQGVVTRADGSAVLAVREDHSCAFLDGDGCGLHKRLGRTGKPRACWRFPYGLVATPSGGRVTTAHYCSCRTLGAPPLDLGEAERSLGDISGRLMADGRFEGDVLLRADESESFAAYEKREGVWIERLVSSGDDPRAFARELGTSWLAIDVLSELGDVLARTEWRTHGGAMLGWFGYGLLALAGEIASGLPERPWRASFERARARSEECSPHAVFADWLADVLWDLEWTSYMPLDRTLGELLVLLDVGYALAARLEAVGARPDCAAAEAVAVIDMTRRSDPWRLSVAKLASG